ncbi:hypothetical protein KHC28_04370 [Ancylobacter sonchi]|uniref:hypothetical protein n=1 Tax=Ancylobacter sonchi TaxID=1937790 RepID=UPI001BD30095|nr:hypothetical protein [Ancylobacter sonchi]MBS7532889.1 hypothetical protein [Ancylobacter sonchi]
MPDPEMFDAAPEWRMGLHLARGGQDRAAYLVIGGVVAVAVEEIGTPVEPVEGVSYLRASWLNPACPRRAELFEEWLDYLWPVPKLSVEHRLDGFPQPEWREERRHKRQEATLAEQDGAGGVAALAPALDVVEARPALAAGAAAGARILPFATLSEPAAVMHRWEAFPVSRRCAAGASSIAPATFAAPEREKAFIPSGFSALARQGLPSVLPTCFLYTLEPMPASVIECGAPASVDGSGGGTVELRFPHATPTRMPILEPVLLPPL